MTIFAVDDCGREVDKASYRVDVGAEVEQCQERRSANEPLVFGIRQTPGADWSEERSFLAHHLSCD